MTKNIYFLFINLIISSINSDSFKKQELLLCCMYLFSNILGVFVFDNEFKIVDEILFNGIDDYRNKENLIDEMKSRHKNAEEPGNDELKKILLCFRDKKFLETFYSRNIEITKSGIKNSVREDILVIQAINSTDDIDKTTNLLAKRLREWYELYNPEFSRSIENHEKFAEEILEKEKAELLKELKISPEDSIGADLSQEDLEPLRSLVHQMYDLYQLRKNLVEYISSSMDVFCPNLKAVCGAITGAKLIEHAGSLKRLSEMPASTIQVLGAEKALFRHMKTGSKPPRHGVIVHHPLIAKSADKMHGKIARALSDKISIAAKVDYFRGKFIGDKLKEELEKKFG